MLVPLTGNMASRPADLVVSKVGAAGAEIFRSQAELARCAVRKELDAMWDALRRIGEASGVEVKAWEQ